jgi:hypothetical protein
MGKWAESRGMHDWAKVLFYASCPLSYNIVIFVIKALSLADIGMNYSI